MVCKMVKRGVLGAAVGAGALALLFGTSAPSYVKTAFHSFRQGVKDSVPPEYQIKVAKQQLSEMEPAIARCTEDVARAEVRVERLEGELLASRERFDRDGKALVALRQHLNTGDVRLTSGLTYTRAEINRDLARRLDIYKSDKKILAEKEETLRLRKQVVQSAREKLDNMKAARQVLASKIEAIEAKLGQVRATQAASAEISFDDSSVDRVKQLVGELEEKVEVMDRVAAHQSRLTDKTVAVEVEPGRDLAKEIDEEFGTPTKGSSTASNDKSL